MGKGVHFLNVLLITKIILEIKRLMRKDVLREATQPIVEVSAFIADETQGDYP